VSERLVCELFAAEYVCRLAVKSPVIRTFFAVLVNTWVGSIERAAISPRCCRYAGVVPSTVSSGGMIWHGRVMKERIWWLRWGLVVAVLPVTVVDAGLRAV
jgi:hypothetical protein